MGVRNKPGDNGRLSSQEDIPEQIVEDATARVAPLTLHEVVHRRVRDQSVLVGEILAANFAGELR